MQDHFFIKIFTSHFIERVVQRFACERELETEHNWNILTPNLWPSRCVFLALLILNRSPGFHSGGCWLSLRHLISIFSGPQFIRASRGPLQPGVAFLPTSRFQLRLIFNSTATQLARRTQLSYIIVWRPLDLWNRMFNRHQAEITVMQFRGHSLPVHHSVVAQWDLHLVPYYQP